MIRSSLIAGILLLAGGLVACGGGTSPPTVGDVTFWQDVAPIYNDKCVRCHQEGGIAPFRLDNYADAQANAALEKQRTAAGTMPPYFMVHDGSCQSFVDDATLTDRPEGDHRRLGRPGHARGNAGHADAAASARAGRHCRRDDAAVRAGRARRTAGRVRRVPLLRRSTRR